MKYFLHDTSAFQDEKISQLFIKFGYEGIGLFYTLLEKIALQEKPVNISVLKKQLYIGKKLEKCWNFLEEIGLICTKNGETFNENLLNFSEKYKIKKEKTREKVSEWRKKNKEKSINFHESLLKLPIKFHESFTKVSLKFDESLDVFQEKINKLKLEGIENDIIEKIVTSYNVVRNQPKVKESKVKESKVIINEFNFKNSFLSLGVDENIFNDWLKVRKLKKGVDTETGYHSILKEIQKSGLTANECIKKAVEKNWCGFEAEWIKNLGGSNGQKKLDYRPSPHDGFKDPTNLKF